MVATVKTSPWLVATVNNILWKRCHADPESGSASDSTRIQIRIILNADPDPHHKEQTGSVNSFRITKRILSLFPSILTELRHTDRQIFRFLKFCAYKKPITR